MPVYAWKIAQIRLIDAAVSSERRMPRYFLLTILPCAATALVQNFTHRAGTC
jgi:hypothetical protein